MRTPSHPVPRLALLLLFGAALTSAGALQAAEGKPAPPQAGPAAQKPGPQLARATFAGGCFWCMESAFEELPGVVSATSGYAGGNKKDPSYEEVSSGGTGHAESVQVVYDPSKITYQKLLEVFWHNIDPTTPDRQFCDAGSQYRSAIFYAGEEQKRLAEESRRTLEKSKPFKEPIVTQIVPLNQFYPAEEYHQDFYKKNPLRYKSYRAGCGRDQRLIELWGRSAH